MIESSYRQLGSNLSYQYPNNNRNRGDSLKSLKEQDAIAVMVSASRAKVMRVVLLVTGAIGSVIALVGILITLELQRVPELSYLQNYKPSATIEVYDRYDKLACSIAGPYKRRMVTLNRVSAYLQRAVLTAEDRRFYEHHGVDPLGIIRATLVNLINRAGRQGGSTITQQLSKNLFFEDKKRGVIVKLAEIIVAAELERRFSKEKILELYLNEVYFGNGAYGIEQAARAYFNKSAYDLTIGEGAYLAGIIRSPTRGALSAYRQSNIARQHEILDRMYSDGYLTPGQWQEARQQPLRFVRAAHEPLTCRIPRFPYYMSYVLERTRDQFTEGEIERHGMRIYTNLDQDAQAAAERVLSSEIHNCPGGVTQLALVSINVRDSAVLAMVGGVGDYLKNQWNNATNPHTIGSAFKPFVYLTGFEQHTLDPLSIVDDSPLVIPEDHGKEYKPKNFDGKFMGDITVAEALAYSRNVCTLRVALKVGLAAIINTAYQAGIKTPLQGHLSLALGCCALSPLEIASAYGCFARGGVRMNPVVIKRIENRHGEILYVADPAPERAFSEDAVAKLVDILQTVVTKGTGTQARLADRPVAGKTGTSDQARDLWFVGFTPDLVTSVWGGNEDNRPVGGSHTTGGTVMARIWREYNKAYYAKHPTPGGWFVACTRIAGNFTFNTRVAREAPRETAKPRYYTTSAPESDAHPRRYRRRSAGSRSSAGYGPAGSAAVRQSRGVTEYNWSR